MRKPAQSEGNRRWGSKPRLFRKFGMGERTPYPGDTRWGSQSHPHTHQQTGKPRKVANPTCFKILLAGLSARLGMGEGLGNRKEVSTAQEGVRSRKKKEKKKKKRVGLGNMPCFALSPPPPVYSNNAQQKKKSVRHGNGKGLILSLLPFSLWLLSISEPCLSLKKEEQPELARSKRRLKQSSSANFSPSMECPGSSR